MTREDIEMVRDIDRWLSVQYNQINSPGRDKRF